MKTNLAEVSRIYQDYLRSAKPEDGRACPTMERLAQCVLDVMPGKERAEIVGHAANCAACAAALKDLFDISAETEGAAAKINSSAEREQLRSSRAARGFFGRLTGRPAVAVMAGIFVLAVLSFTAFRLLDRSGIRGGLGARVLLVSPVAGSISRDGLEFRWQRLAGSDHYRVELFDESLKLVWRSGPVSGSELRPADAVCKGLDVGKTYYWIVTAVRGDHSETKSRLAEFSIKY